MSSVNKAIIVGRLGKDPEMRFTKSGDGVCSFSVATSEKWKDKSGQKQERTTWHRIVIWGKLGEISAEYLKKGSQVYLEGRIEHREYEDNDGNKKQITEIIAHNMTMLDQAGGSQTGPSDEEEDIPF